MASPPEPRRPHPAPPQPATLMPLVEAGVILALAYGVLARVPDLTPLLGRALGIRFGLPEFAVLDPLYPLLRGLLAGLVVAYVVRLLCGQLVGAGTRSAAPGSRDRILAAIAWMLIFLAVLAPAARDMFDRAVFDEAPGAVARYVSRTHDGGVLQTEAAIDALREGRNPYAIDYGDTAMARARDSDPARWRGLGYERNPALGHLPYLPAAFLLPLPLEVVMEGVFGWYDQRVFYLLVALAFVVLAGRLAEPGRARRIVWLLVGLSPLLLPFLRQGRNDVVVLALLAGAALGVDRRRWAWAGLALGLACATKQFAWVPAFFLLLWALADSSIDRRDARRFIAVTMATALAVALPFFVWSPGAFVGDVLLFQVGIGDNAYPLRPDSLGLAALVVGLGWATNLREGFPMWVFQLLLTLPLTVWASYSLWRRPSLQGAWSAAAVVLLAGLFCSSFFALNYWAHPAYLLMLAVLATPRLAGWRSG